MRGQTRTRNHVGRFLSTLFSVFVFIGFVGVDVAESTPPPVKAGPPDNLNFDTTFGNSDLNVGAEIEGSKTGDADAESGDGIDGGEDGNSGAGAHVPDNKGLDSTRSGDSGPAVNRPAGELTDVTTGTVFMYDDVTEAEEAGATCEPAGPIINAGMFGGDTSEAPASGSQSVYCSFPAEEPDGSEPVQAAAQPIVITRSYFESLPIAPQTPLVEPSVGWIPVNMPMVVSATADAEQFDLDVLGTPVSIRAIPVAWTWDWGDGTSDTYETPGAPWPSKDVAHTYSEAAEVQVTLTTTYRGEFAVNGGAWQDIAGTTTVSSESVPMGVEEFESRLTTGG